MKRILCYGDSNTFGTVPLADPTAEGQRYDEHTRWCGVLRDTLGEGWEIIEDGVGGRCTIYGEGEEAYKNGEPTLLPSLQAAAPLDAVVMMLGTNDLRLDRGVTEETMDVGIRRLTEIVLAHPECGKDGQLPRLLIVSPIVIAKPTGRGDFYEARGFEIGVKRSELFKPVYAKVAADYGCDFMAAADFAESSVKDALHMEPESHRALGEAVAAKLREMLA